MKISMDNEQLRIAVAEALGWREPRLDCYDDMIGGRYAGGVDPNTGKWSFELPNWPEDLNACHEFEEGLTDIEFCRYTQILCGHTTPGERICWGGEDAWRACHATARQRCLAFLAATKGEKQ